MKKRGMAQDFRTTLKVYLPAFCWWDFILNEKTVVSHMSDLLSNFWTPWTLLFPFSWDRGAQMSICEHLVHIHISLLGRKCPCEIEASVELVVGGLKGWQDQSHWLFIKLHSIFSSSLKCEEEVYLYPAETRRLKTITPRWTALPRMDWEGCHFIWFTF